MWRRLTQDTILNFRLAARNLRRHLRRTALALLTVGAGIVAFLLAGGFIHWVFDIMRESTIYSQLGHVQITRPNFRTVGQSDPYRFLLPAEIPALSGDDDSGIVTIAPRLTFTGLLSKGDSTVSFLGEGIDPEREAPITRAITIQQGKDLTQSGPKSVLLGEGLARSIGAAPGDLVVLLATTERGAINAVEVEVVGIFSTITKAYDDVAMRAPIDVARQLMKISGATTWVVLLDDTDKTEQAVAHLRSALPSSEFEVTPWSDLADFYNKTVELFTKQIGVVRLLIALIVVLSISNTLAMSVVERTNEIGTAMALGVRRSAILRLFVSEGVLIGLVGGVIGVVAGVLAGQIISAIGIPMPPPPGMARGYIGQIAISPALVFDALLLAVSTTLLASLFPAWKASRMNVVDALRHQR